SSLRAHLPSFPTRRSSDLVSRVFEQSIPRDGRRVVGADARLPGMASPLPAQIHLWPSPRTYTGQDIAEIHTLGSPPLVDLLVAEDRKSTRLNSSHDQISYA